MIEIAALFHVAEEQTSASKINTSEDFMSDATAAPAAGQTLLQKLMSGRPRSRN